MATLVFSTVGTILGGPVGGALGALVGQSIDREVLGPAARGPKVGDLSVQTSSYGTQIPRVYGAMRVAGSVIWSTDLVQSEQTSGAKGQPDLTYSYSVSFAVALSSRPLRSIGRVWADGKLIREAGSEFSVPTIFRFLPGGEDQEVDPLIASIEGIATTPAYRGMALAVFEGLELAAFGNRIPFLTFEVFGDDLAPTIGGILADCSNGAIVVGEGPAVSGYAAYGSSVRAAAEPLVEAFEVRLFDDGRRLRSPGAGATMVSDAELGNSADGDAEPRLRREQRASRDLPVELRLRFYDPSRDYQSGEVRASAGDHAGREEKSELAATIGSEAAKALAQRMLAVRWIARDRLSVSLPPGQLGIEPGSRLSLPLTPSDWVAEEVTIEGFAVKVALRPDVGESPSIVAADSGRYLASVDSALEPFTVALIDTASVLSTSSDEPILYLAASSPNQTWSAQAVEVETGTSLSVVSTAARKTVLGFADAVLGRGSQAIVDTVNSLDVTLIDPDQWLTNCDDAALFDGANLAVLGSEIIQFGRALPLGEGRFRLSRLLRGRRGTEQFIAGHRAGETFAMLDPRALVPLAIPIEALGATVKATPVRGGGSAQVAVSAASIRPIAPVRVRGEIGADGSLVATWTRRSRRGWAWIDETDAPIGEDRELYRLELSGSGSAISQEVGAEAIHIPAAKLAALGGGPLSVTVRQVGSFAASPPTTAIINAS